MNEQEFANFVSNPEWTLTASVVIGGLMRLAKEGKLGVLLPARYRPVMVLVLAALSAALESYVKHTGFLAATSSAFCSAAFAIMAHDVVVHSARGGVELGRKREKPLPLPPPLPADEQGDKS